MALKRPPIRGKKYMSLFGCCVCAVKTARLAFVKSTRYEAALKHCLRYEGRRSGEVCCWCLRKLRRWLVAESRVMRAERAAAVTTTGTSGNPNSLKIKHLAGIPASWHIPGSTVVPDPDLTVDEPDWQTYPALDWATVITPTVMAPRPKRARNEVVTMAEEGPSGKRHLREHQPSKAPCHESCRLTPSEPNQLSPSHQPVYSIQPDCQEEHVYYGKIGQYKLAKFVQKALSNQVEGDSPSRITTTPVISENQCSDEEAEDFDPRAPLVLNRATDAVTESGVSGTNQSQVQVAEKDLLDGRQLRVRQPRKMPCQGACCQTLSKPKRKKRRNPPRKFQQHKHSDCSKKSKHPKYSKQLDCQKVQNYQGQPKIEQTTRNLDFIPDVSSKEGTESSTGFVTSPEEKEEPYSGPDPDSEPDLPPQSEDNENFEKDDVPKSPEILDTSQAPKLDLPKFEDPSYPLPSGSNLWLTIEGKNWFLDDSKSGRFRYLLEPVKNKNPIPREELPKWMQPRRSHPRYRRSRDYYTNSYLLPRKFSLTCKRDMDLWSILSRKEILSEELPPLAGYSDDPTRVNWAIRKLHKFRNDITAKQDKQFAEEAQEAQEAAAAREALVSQKTEALKDAKVQAALCLQKVRAMQAALQCKNGEAIQISTISNKRQAIHESIANPENRSPKKLRIASEHDLNSLGLPRVIHAWPRSPALVKQTAPDTDDIQVEYAFICHLVRVKREKDSVGIGKTLQSKGQISRRIFRGPKGKILVFNELDEVQQLEEMSDQN